MIRFLVPLPALFALVSVAAAAPGDARWLERAVESAQAGAIIGVPAGDYDIADLKIRRNLSLIGEGEVVFFSSRPVEKGILNPVGGAALSVENIAFKGARSPDLNGAGIRHDGGDLSVIACAFISNENGILYTGDEKGRIRIERSGFEGNGQGDGYSHGIYVNEAASLEIEASRFAGTRIGHHVKSLARTTRIAHSQFDDTGGHTSYALDASAGGDVAFIGNSVIKSADADNPSIINYDLTRGGDATRLLIEGNRIVNRHPNGQLLRNATTLAPTVSGNEVVNQAGGRLALGAPANPD